MRTLAVIVVFWCLAIGVRADTTAVDGFTPPEQPLGLHMSMLTEEGAELTLGEVRRLAESQKFAPAHSPVLGIGIGGPVLNFV